MFKCPPILEPFKDRVAKFDFRGSAGQLTNEDNADFDIKRYTLRLEND